MILELTVIGRPQQMGSKRAFVPAGGTVPIITDSNRNLKSWQTMIATEASRAIAARPPADRALLTGAVRLTVAFYFPRPKAHGRKEHPHVTAPDLDKVCRSTADALTGIAYADDRQVVELVARKRYAAPGHPPHAVIRVEPCAGIDSLFHEESAYASV